MNKERLNDLIEKYKQGRISRFEYQELLNRLNEPGIEGDLDKVLNHYWKEADSRLADFSSPFFLSQKPYTTTHRLTKSTAQRHIWWGIAATIIMIVGFFLYLNGTPDILKNQEVVYQTGFGERQEITLDDGSQITLNANSIIRWSNDWEDSRSRNVTLKGEAFFEVKKQDGIPFTVHTDDVAVEVLGTSFNVDSRQEKTEVYLDEGKVNLKLMDKSDSKILKPESREEIEREFIMKPGDQVRYDATVNKIEITEGQDMITAAAWKNNVLNFKNMKFGEVLDLLREIYGQSFECSESELLSTPMYIGVPYSDWEAVRQALELSLNVEFQVVDSRRYKVISTKHKNSKR